MAHRCERGVANGKLVQFLRKNSVPRRSVVGAISSSKRSPTAGKVIMIMYTIHRENGVDGVAFEFRRLAKPDKGTFVEKVLRDLISANDKRLVGPPMNIVNASYGAHRNNVRVLNSKGYELSVFVAIQNFKGKTEGQVRQFARMFGMVIKQHIESDPKSLNQMVVVAEENIHYSKDNVFMDFIGERNAMTLYRSVLPNFTNKSEYFRSFFRDGSIAPESVALMKSRDSFLKQQDAANKKQNEDKVYDKSIIMYVTKYSTMGERCSANLERNDDDLAYDAVYEAARVRLMELLRSSPTTATKEIEQNPSTNEGGNDSK